MSTSSEANPSTDSRRDIDDPLAMTVDEGAQDLPSAAQPGGVDEDQHSWPDLPRSRTRAAGPDPLDNTDGDEARTIQAGPDLEIVPDETQTAAPNGHAPSEATSQSGSEVHATEKNQGRSVDQSEGQPDHQAVDQPAADHRDGADRSGDYRDTGDRPASEHRSAGEIESREMVGQARIDAAIAPPERRSGPVAVAAFLVGRIDSTEAARHVVEHRQPLLWIWRRAVGMSFAYILISVTWFLIKLPDALVADATIPSQVQVAAGFHELRIDGLAGATLGAHAGSSLFRFATGLGVGAALGITLGIITGSAPLVRTIVDPVTSFFRLVPGLAVGPLLLVWFGLGEAGLISVVAFSVMWSTMASASDGRTATIRRGAASNTGSDRVTVDAVFGAVRAAVLTAWTTMLAIETVAASTGLGAMIWFAQGRSDLVVAGILVVGLIGFAIDSALRLTHYVITHDVAVTARR